MISDAKGRAAFDAPPGEYDISAEAAGHLPATLHVVAERPKPVACADRTLADSRGGRIRHRDRDAYQYTSAGPACAR